MHSINSLYTAGGQSLCPSITPTCTTWQGTTPHPPGHKAMRTTWGSHGGMPQDPGHNLKRIIHILTTLNKAHTILMVQQPARTVRGAAQGGEPDTSETCFDSIFDTSWPYYSSDPRTNARAWGMCLNIHFHPIPSEATCPKRTPVLQITSAAM